MLPLTKRLPPDSRSLFQGFTILIAVYAALRLLFFLVPALKSLLFIAPAGGLVALFWGGGSFIDGEWLYQAGGLQIRFGAVCSGTTFFSLLSAYTTMQWASGRRSAWWLAACYPLALAANAARVLCSIYMEAATAHLLSPQMLEHLHLLVGVAVFSTTFAGLILYWERDNLRRHFDHTPH